MVGDAVVQIEPTEPAVGQIKIHFFAKPLFRSDAKAISKQQHARQQFGIG